MNGCDMLSLAFTVRELGMELIARGAQIPLAALFQFTDKEGSPQRDVDFRAVKALYGAANIPPRNPRLKHFTLYELLLKIRQMIQEKKLDGERGVWGSDERMDIYSGNSGSPVFCAETHEMVGMLVRSDPQDFRRYKGGWISVNYPNKRIEGKCSRQKTFSNTLRFLECPGKVQSKDIGLVIKGEIKIIKNVKELEYIQGICYNFFLYPP